MKRFMLSVIGGLIIPLVVGAIAALLLFSGVTWLSLIGFILFLTVGGVCIPLRLLFPTSDELVLAGIICDFFLYSLLTYAFLRWRHIGSEKDEDLRRLVLEIK